MTTDKLYCLPCTDGDNEPGAHHHPQCFKHQPKYQLTDWAPSDTGITEFHTGSVRDSSVGKPHFEHLTDVEEGVKAMCEVLEFGKEKYSRNNWRKGQTYMRVLASMFRHAFAFAHGEDIDPESGKSHLGHIMCNAAFLEHFRVYPKQYAELDDRDGYEQYRRTTDGNA